MYTVDASVWVNAFDRREPGHQVSRQFLEVLRDQALPIIVPNLGELSRAPQSSEQFVWLNRRYGETETQLNPSAIMPSTRADASQHAVI